MIPAAIIALVAQTVTYTFSTITGSFELAPITTEWATPSECDHFTVGIYCDENQRCYSMERAASTTMVAMLTECWPQNHLSIFYEDQECETWRT